MKVSGKVVADAISEKLKREIEKFKIKPHLAIILTDEDAASRLYVNFKIKRAEEIGVAVRSFEFSQNQLDELEKTIEKLNADPKVHGIIIQYPVYKAWNFDELAAKIDPKKDVDGFLKESPFRPATAQAIWEMLTDFALLEGFQRTEEFLKGKKIVLLGKGKTAGGPIRGLLQEKGVVFSLIDSKTENPNELIKNADVVISATGRKNIITGDKIKNGSYVIGVGMGKENGETYGDIEEKSISKRAKLYCPTIGGIGPLTVVCLLRNVIQSAKKAEG